MVGFVSGPATTLQDTKYHRIETIRLSVDAHSEVLVESRPSGFAERVLIRPLRRDPAWVRRSRNAARPGWRVIQSS